MVAGVGLLYLYQPLGERLSLAIAGLGLIGGMALIVWLLIKGVNVERWQRATLA